MASGSAAASSEPSRVVCDPHDRLRGPLPSGPGTEEKVFRYRLHSPVWDDLGEATYAMMIKPGEEIHGAGGQRLRVVDVVPFDEIGRTPFSNMNGVHGM